MKILKLIFKNAFRHKLRTFLTILGIGIAVMGFALMRFVVNAWNAGVDIAAADRLIVRHAVSFVFSLAIFLHRKNSQQCSRCSRCHKLHLV